MKNTRSSLLFRRLQRSILAATCCGAIAASVQAKSIYVTSFEPDEGFANNSTPNGVGGWEASASAANPNRFLVTDTQAYDGTQSLLIRNASGTSGYPAYYALSPDYFAHEATSGSLYFTVSGAQWAADTGADYIARWEVYLGETQGSYSRLAMILRWGDTEESDFIIRAENGSGSYVVNATRTLVGSGGENGLSLDSWNKIEFSLNYSSDPYSTLTIKIGDFELDSPFQLTSNFTEETFIGRLRFQANTNAGSYGTVYYDYIHLYGVPEPSTWMLLGCGAAALVMMARKRRKN